MADAPSGSLKSRGLQWAATCSARVARLWVMPGRRFWPALGCVLFLTSLWQYRSTLGGGIEDYDPTRHFASDSYHKVVLESREAPWRYFTGGFLASAYLRSRIFYRPLSSLYFWTNRKLFDLHPLPWRVTAVAWHALGITLLGLFAATCAGSRVPGALAACWFVAYGRHEEDVTWLAANPDLVVAVLCLACVAVLWRARWPYAWRVAASAALLLIALLTKESASFVPVFLVATVFWWPVPDGAKRRVFSLAMMAAVSAVYLAIYALATGNLFGAVPGSYATQLHIGLRAYLRLMWPPAHSMILFLPSLQLGWIVLLAESLWRLIWQHIVYYGGAVLLFWRAWRPTLLFVLWAATSPLPTLLFLNWGERYMHLPSMGWSALSGLLLWQVGLLAVQQGRRRWAPLGGDAAVFSPAAAEQDNHLDPTCSPTPP